MADTDKYKQVIELTRSIQKRMDALNKIVGNKPVSANFKEEFKAPEEDGIDPGGMLISLAETAGEIGMMDTEMNRSLATGLVNDVKELTDSTASAIDKAGAALGPLDDKIAAALKDAAPGAAAAAAKAASDSINVASAALASTEKVIQDSLKDIPADQLKEGAAAAMITVSEEAQKAADAAAKIAAAATQTNPEIAAKAKAVADSLNGAINKAKNAVGSEAAQATAALSKAVTESASSLSNITRDVATYAASLDPEAAAQLKETIGTITSSAIDAAQAASGAIQGLSQKLGPYLHTAAMALGATSLTALAASPALPVIAAVASIIMVVMHQKKMHSKLVSKMKAYFETLMQMMEIYRIMSIIGKRMKYTIDDGQCILALNEFKAYLYLTSPPSIRKAFEDANENTDRSGKKKELKWIEKTSGLLQRVFASSTIVSNLQDLFDDIITSFLLTLSKFNMVTAIHSDVLASMKSEITQLDEVIKFFDRIQIKPVKECTTDEECQAAAAVTAKQLEDSMKMAGVKAEDVKKNLIASEKVIAKVEASAEFKKDSKTKGWFNLFGKKETPKKGGSRQIKIKGKFRTKRLPRSGSKN